MSQDDILHHLHRVQGQLQGVERMVQKCRPCSEIAMQLMATRSSIEKITLKLLEQETELCVRSSDKSTQRRLKDVARTLFHYT
ncbi:MAG: metal-sensitive transcriptional regulator [Patescibacteria group bacterium]|jgi:DNA-binding FrmR family transcriptional regulator